jgi:hypothetical protein
MPAADIARLQLAIERTVSTQRSIFRGPIRVLLFFFRETLIIGHPGQNQHGPPDLRGKRNKSAFP